MTTAEIDAMMSAEAIRAGVQAVERETVEGAGIVVPSPYRCAQLAVMAAIAHAKECGRRSQCASDRKSFSKPLQHEPGA